MKIIPVIDLKNGIVVHARQGQRHNYQAINTPLCSSSKPMDVLKAFLTLSSFDTFYIADLNAIEGQGDNHQSIVELAGQFASIIFWVDAGLQQFEKSSQYPYNYLPVIGSEYCRNDTLARLNAFNKRFVLSLDYSLTKQLGTQAIFESDRFWPDKIIIMTLARVGSNSGPDIQRLATFCQNYPDKQFIAAGGIRDKQDLIDLEKLGVTHALVASALHSGAINTDDIGGFQAKKYLG